MSDTKGYRAILLLRVVAWVFVAFGVLPAAAFAATAAMVTDLQGKATVVEAGRSFDAGILASIEVGAQIQLRSGSTLVVLYVASGDEYVFKGPALIVFRLSQPEVLNGPAAQKNSPAPDNGVRIKPTGMGQGALVMRSVPISARVRLLSLSGTKVLETQPEFQWQEPQPGLTYLFEIADDTGRSLYEAQVDTTSFRLPVGLQLKEGQSYAWAVSTRLPDGRKYSSVGDFSIASAALREQAMALRVAASAPVSTRVAYAAWLDQVDLKDEARKYWRGLHVERPEDLRLKSLAEH